MIQIKHDKHGGITADINTLPDSLVEFEREIASLIKSNKDKRLLWIKVPIKKSEFIPALTNLNFEFHHCSTNHLMLVKQLVQESKIPTAKTHTVGVGAIVLNRDKILVVKDNFSSGYKLPGGYINVNETIKDAIKREVFEETGVTIEFESIANIGHFMNGQFQEPSLYLVCTAIATSTKITIYDASEITEAKWIDIDQFLSSTETNNYNKSAVTSVLANNELKLTNKTISLRVRGEVFS